MPMSAKNTFFSAGYFNGKPEYNFQLSHDMISNVFAMSEFNPIWVQLSLPGKWLPELSCPDAAALHWLQGAVEGLMDRTTMFKWSVLRSRSRSVGSTVATDWLLTSIISSPATRPNNTKNVKQRSDTIRYDQRNNESIKRLVQEIV